MVLTKSISRFARNTVTLLENGARAETLGVDVYFEEQDIHSLSGDGELMLTILGVVCAGREPFGVRELQVAHPPEISAGHPRDCAIDRIPYP